MTSSSQQMLTTWRTTESKLKFRIAPQRGNLLIAQGIALGFLMRWVVSPCKGKSIDHVILLPLQGVISFCVHTQGVALGYWLLALQAVSKL